MTWFKVDDQLHDHRKVRKLGKDKMPATGLWALCGSWAADNLTDGFIPTEIVRRHDPMLKYAKRLVAVGFWEPAEQDGEDGFQFHDWGDHQPTRREVLGKREEARDRMRRIRRNRRQGGDGSQDVRANVRGTLSEQDTGIRSQNGNDGSETWSRNGNESDLRRDLETPDDPRSKSETAGSAVVFARTSREVTQLPSRPVPSRSSSSSVRVTVANALGLDEDDEDVTKVIDLIERENRPTAPGPYIRTLAVNGDLPAFLDRVRSPTAASPGVGASHAFEDDGDGDCRHCPMPRDHPRHDTGSPHLTVVPDSA